MSKREIDVDELQDETSDQALHLRKRIQDLEKEKNELRRKLGEQKELIDSVKAAITERPLPKQFQYTRAQKKNNPIVPVLKISDIHGGEKTEKDETEGFGVFNWEIAQRRMHGIVMAFLNWVEVQRKAYHIETCHLCCEGDYISGDIHQELLVTNEFPLPVQTAKVGLLLGEVFRAVSGHFKNVHVNMVGADNHGRLTRKPQAKQKAANNMSFLVHTIAMTYADRCRNLHFNVAAGMKMLIDINGVPVLSEHGDTIRGWAGFPYYGMGRLIGKEAKRRMNTDKGFKYHSIGHFHCPAFIEGTTIVNGSLSGTSEFDHSCGRHAEPCQVAYLMHPKHGLFNMVPFQG